MRRCLTKDLKQRLQAIGEARIALERGGEYAAAPGAPVPSRSAGRFAWVPWALEVENLRARLRVVGVSPPTDPIKEASLPDLASEFPEHVEGDDQPIRRRGSARGLDEKEGAIVQGHRIVMMTVVTGVTTGRKECPFGAGAECVSRRDLDRHEILCTIAEEEFLPGMGPERLGSSIV